MTLAIAIVVIACLGAFEMLVLYDFMNDCDKIPTSMYYKKIARLQKEIEKLTEKRQKLKIETGYFDKVEIIEKQIKAKKKEIRRVKIHIKIEDDAHKY